MVCLSHVNENLDTEEQQKKKAQDDTCLEHLSGEPQSVFYYSSASGFLSAFILDVVVPCSPDG